MNAFQIIMEREKQRTQKLMFDPVDRRTPVLIRSRPNGEQGIPYMEPRDHIPRTNMLDHTRTYAP